MLFRQNRTIFSLVFAAAALFVPARSDLSALPEGFTDHGIAAPVGRQPFGNNVFATVGEDGRRAVFLKLWAAGGATYLFIDAETGETEQIDPKLPGRGGWPVFLSPDQKVYDTLGNYMIEIDLETREFRRVGEIPRNMSLGITMDSEGVIYAGIYPGATLVSYDPAKELFRNHGNLATESWPQYLRPLAAGEDGWVYGGIGQKLAQVLAHHPESGETRALIPENKRKAGRGEVFLGADGSVYANAPGWGWHAIKNGKAKPVEKPGARATQPSTQVFPDGSRLASIDVANRTMRILDAGAESPREVKFSYKSAGVPVYGVTAGPDGNIYGATGVPLRVWRFQPESGQMDDWGLAGHAGHVNQFALQNGKLYGAVYSSGSLIEYDPSKPFHDARINRSRNPKQLHGGVYGHGGNPDMFGRPYVIFAHPDGKHVVMGGNPSRVRNGGGLLIYNTETGDETALKPDQLIPNQGTMTVGALANGDLIVGSTTAAATAGQSAATVAEVYRIDWETKELIERWIPQPSVRSIRDLLVGENGFVYIQATGNRFLVLDPERGEFIHDETITDYGAQTGGQAPRVMAFGPDGKIYILFRDVIAQFDPETFVHKEVARPGVRISSGIAIQDGRLYFATTTRLLSYELE